MSTFRRGIGLEVFQDNGGTLLRTSLSKQLFDHRIADFLPDMVQFGIETMQFDATTSLPSPNGRVPVEFCLEFAYDLIEGFNFTGFLPCPFIEYGWCHLRYSLTHY